MRILRRAGYPRRTPHKKSACPTGPTTGPGPQSRPWPVPTPVPIDTDVRWIHGSPSPRRLADPPLQVHHLAPGTVLIRQSKDVTFEAPFILLLLGERRALLLDTGAVDGATLRETVDGLVADWTSARTTPDAYDLVVAHTHGHGDHVAGDAAFTGRPHTTVVGHDVEAVRAFFGFADWPDRGRHARPRRPHPRGLRHPRPPRGLDRGPRPDDRAAAHGRHGLSRSHLRRRPHRSPRTPSTGSSPSPRSAASSTCSAATSR